MGEKHPLWRGGKRPNDEGYIRLIAKNHPLANCDGYVMEHRLVMEKKLGRYLTRDEVVHHIDGDRANNAAENLAVFANAAEHNAYHAKYGVLHRRSGQLDLAAGVA